MLTHEASLDAGGLPKGFSSRAAIRIGTSCAWQLMTHAACSAENGRNAGKIRTEGTWHNSNAVHRTHAKLALMKIPSLEEYEEQAAAKLEQPNDPNIS